MGAGGGQIDILAAEIFTDQGPSGAAGADARHALVPGCAGNFSLEDFGIECGFPVLGYTHHAIVP
jgi:hypothetical protein